MRKRMAAAFGSSRVLMTNAGSACCFVAVMLLTWPPLLGAQEAAPHTRTVQYMGVSLELTVWDADSARARLALDDGQAAALLADTVLPPGHRRMDSTKRRLRLARKESVQDAREVAQAAGLDATTVAMQRAGARAGSAEVPGNVLYFGRPPLGDSWGVLLQHPHRAQSVSALVPLEEGGAVATVTGTPADPPHPTGTVGVTVIAPSALTARIFARALLVLGPVAGCAVAAQEPALHAVWFDDDAGVEGTRIVLTPDLASRIRFSADAVTVRTATCGQAAAGS
jgi:hypothetical protein